MCFGFPVFFLLRKDNDSFFIINNNSYFQWNSLFCVFKFQKYFIKNDVHFELLYNFSFV